MSIKHDIYPPYQNVQVILTNYEHSTACFSQIFDHFLTAFLLKTKRAVTAAAESFGIAVPVATSAAHLHVPVVSENALAFLPYFQLLRLV